MRVSQTLNAYFNGTSTFLFRRALDTYFALSSKLSLLPLTPNTQLLQHLRTRFLDKYLDWAKFSEV